jgi:hypothetical protein
MTLTSKSIWTVRESDMWLIKNGRFLQEFLDLSEWNVQRCLVVYVTKLLSVYNLASTLKNKLGNVCIVCKFRHLCQNFILTFANGTNVAVVWDHWSGWWYHYHGWFPILFCAWLGISQVTELTKVKHRNQSIHGNQGSLGIPDPHKSVCRNAYVDLHVKHLLFSDFNQN